MFHHILLRPLHVYKNAQCTDKKYFVWPAVTPKGLASNTLAAPGSRFWPVLAWNVVILASLGPDHPIQYISRPYSLPYISMEHPTLHCRPYHTIPHHTIPYRTVPYHIMPYHTIPYHIMLYYDIPYCTMSYGELSKSIWAGAALGGLWQNRPWSSQVKGIHLIWNLILSFGFISSSIINLLLWVIADGRLLMGRS